MVKMFGVEQSVPPLILQEGRTFATEFWFKKDRPSGSLADKIVIDTTNLAAGRRTAA